MASTPYVVPDGDTALFTGILDEIQVTLYIVTAEVFLYGIYTVLFGFYLHVLHTRGIPNNRFLTVATISLFLLCSTHLALLAASTVLNNQFLEGVAIELYLAGDKTSSNNLGVALTTVYVTSNLIADSIFIFRCYAIWNFRQLVIIIPVVLTVAVAVLGYLDAFWATNFQYPNFSFSWFLIFPILPITVSLLTTFILMAGRIWWLARTAQKVMGQRITSRYYTICAMILESGALYCASGIAYLIFTFRVYGTYTTSGATSGAVVGQLVGIAPTIIAVRVGLGKSVESVDSFIATARPRARSPLEFQPAVASADVVESRVLYLRPQSDHAVEVV
ncbi:hypothetical protein DFH07DRAFT_770053 [Mycena maculata]|uniref:Uncharacterized protein n=1 Tax=Mycena maculata TaxID=230809 RepID=A0AAD7NLS6_9AGAR|nr:hypothetical protein DFH07DRAFT_770053 [Mycena maculata]